GVHILNNLTEKGYQVNKIFTPEHGFSADDKFSNAGVEVPVISLYGKKTSFSREDLEGIDVVIFDIQELGVRFYTYTSTLYLTMQDAARYGKEYIVCDRPSIANLNYTGGFMLDEKFSSFVGKIPAAAIYGLTIGELANFLNSEFVKNPGFSVVQMKEYWRNKVFENVMSSWVNPSPSIVSIDCARNYPALCFLEGTNISEGRGTDYPFCVFGAPFVDSGNLLEELNKYAFEGVEFSAAEFTPEQEKLPSYTAMKFTGKKCYGLRMKVTDVNKFRAFDLSVAVLLSLKKTAPGFAWEKGNFIDKLAGTDRLRKMINEGYSYDEIISESRKESEEFAGKSSPYRLYK
ncbi:MAG: DUF1343 domain-containing protein, partial [Bacteroidetes bacterium]|nr:DUF1343 domain-containing protein [Bacteroidota bacterium]